MLVVAAAPYLQDFSPELGVASTFVRGVQIHSADHRVPWRRIHYQIVNLPKLVTEQKDAELSVSQNVKKRRWNGGSEDAP